MKTTKNNTQKRRAVIYARYSSHGQREESIEGQLRECHEYAKYNNMEVVGEYIDRAISGTTDKRPDFQRMMRDSEKGLFDVLIVWKIDRFARNRYDSANHKFRLKKNGVTIHYAKERIPEGPEGIILESVLEGFAEYYSANLSQNVKRGQYENAKDSRVTGSIPFGYKKGADGKFEIIPREAAIVKEIFENYANGLTDREVTAKINSKGYTKANGEKFKQRGVASILRNERYTGVYIFGSVRNENGMPAIVTKETYERVQNMRRKHKESPWRHRGRNFILTSKLYCGDCGAWMVGDTSTSANGTSYAYYTCQNRKDKDQPCKMRTPKDDLENFVVKALVELIHTDNFVDKIADKVMEYQGERPKQDKTVLQNLEAKLKEVDKAIDGVVDLAEQGVPAEKLKKRISDLEEDRKILNFQIEEEKERLQNEKFNYVERDHIVFFLECLIGEEDIYSVKYKEQLIRTFVNAIFYYGDEIVIVLNYTGGDGKNNKITISKDDLKKGKLRNKTSADAKLELPA